MLRPQTKVVVLQHAQHEHLGRFGDILRKSGVSFDTIRPDLGERVPSELEGYSGLILMGGPQSVYEEGEYPFLKSEKQLVRNAIFRNRPIFGICLGSQILAEVLGARVYPGSSFELGWKRINLSPGIKQDRVLGHLPEIIIPMHWHGDIYDLPQDALSVGSSDATTVQGFVVRERFYGLLFHLEMTLEQVAEMAQAFPEDLARSGVSKASLLIESPKRLDALKDGSDETFSRWTTLL